METATETQINLEALNEKLVRTRNVQHASSYVLLYGGHQAGWTLKTFDPTQPKPGTRQYNFEFNLYTGEWESLATGKTGANVIELWSYRLGCTLEEAARRICEQINISVPLVGQPID